MRLYRDIASQISELVIPAGHLQSYAQQVLDLNQYCDNIISQSSSCIPCRVVINFIYFAIPTAIQVEIIIITTEQFQLPLTSIPW